MRCRNTRTDNPPRVSLFIFIVKANMEIFCLTYRRKQNIYRIRGRLIASPTNEKMNNKIVGEDIILPRSHRSQNTLSSVAETK